MLSGAAVGDVIQPLPAFSNNPSLSTAVTSAPSVSTTSTSAVAQPPSTRRAAAIAGRQFNPTLNSLSKADAPHSGSVPVSSTVERDSHMSSKAATTTDVSQDRFPADIRRLGASSSSVNIGRDQAGMAVDGKDVLSSRRGRLVQPVNVPTSAEAESSFPVGKNDSSSTSSAHQRPSSSTQSIRPTPHRSALSGNTRPATSTVETVAGAATTETAPEPSSPSSTKSSNSDSLPQDIATLDAVKAVSQFVKGHR